MDIGVHRLGGHIQMQDAGGELPDHDGPFIGLLQGGGHLVSPGVDDARAEEGPLTVQQLGNHRRQGDDNIRHNVGQHHLGFFSGQFLN